MSLRLPFHSRQLAQIAARCPARIEDREAAAIATCLHYFDLRKEWAAARERQRWRRKERARRERLLAERKGQTA